MIPDMLLVDEMNHERGKVSHVSTVSTRATTKLPHHSLLGELVFAIIDFTNQYACLSSFFLCVLAIGLGMRVNLCLSLSFPSFGQNPPYF
jgi:hypothetical protein